MEDTPLAPGLLIAMPQLLDPNFRRAVVLLVHHDDEGTFGLVVNREAEITVERLCDALDIDWGGDDAMSLGWGGPVQPNTGWMIFDSSDRQALDEATGVAPGLHVAGSLDALRRVAMDPPEHLRLLLGYAGWAPGQLEQELAQGAWLLAPASPEVVFDVEPEAMWEHVVRSLGIDPTTLVATPGVH